MGKEDPAVHRGAQRLPHGAGTGVQHVGQGLAAPHLTAQRHPVHQQSAQGGLDPPQGFLPEDAGLLPGAGTAAAEAPPLQKPKDGLHALLGSGSVTWSVAGV